MQNIRSMAAVNAGAGKANEYIFAIKCQRSTNADNAQKVGRNWFASVENIWQP